MTELMIVGSWRAWPSLATCGLRHTTTDSCWPPELGHHAFFDIIQTRLSQYTHPCSLPVFDPVLGRWSIRFLITEIRIEIVILSHITVYYVSCYTDSRSPHPAAERPIATTLLSSRHHFIPLVTEIYAGSLNVSLVRCPMQISAVSPVRSGCLSLEQQLG